MKRKSRKKLAKGLKRIQSKFYCRLSETEHQILDRSVSELKRSRHWIKTLKKFFEPVATSFMKLF